tara:strand:+ start:681 stop:1613 length:933 start_codon:yes stop_codon:yes gene_type:complete
MSFGTAEIKELRESTGAGMMDCKKALSETNGNMEEAVDWLRTKGLASAAKKSGRIAAEGLVAVSSADDNKAAAIVEVNSETDFVARNEQFQNVAEAIAKYAVKTAGVLEDLQEYKCDTFGKPVKDVITDTIATIGENINLRRASGLSVSNGAVASYVHAPVKPGLGKIGVLVALESTGDQDKLLQFGKQVAMHIAATNPEAMTREGVQADSIERERSVFREQALASGKPENIVEKMVEGRISKFYKEVVLLEQEYVIEGKISVQEAVDNFAKELGADVKVVDFVRFGLGEGIEKKEEDFAEEVKKAAGAA